MNRRRIIEDLLALCVMVFIVWGGGHIVGAILTALGVN